MTLFLTGCLALALSTALVCGIILLRYALDAIAKDRIWIDDHAERRPRESGRIHPAGVAEARIMARLQRERERRPR